VIDSVQEARDQLAKLVPDGERLGEIRLELDGPVGRLVLDNPGARSAVSLSMMVDLAEAVQRLYRWDGALVVVSSTDPRVFCSGGHLKQLVRSLDEPDKARTMARAMTVVLEALGEVPAVTVAAVDGLAIGGGAELLTATDFRVCSPEARIHFVQARLGIAPGWGGTRRLTRIVGAQAALRILTTARALFPGEAADLGLVDHRCEGRAEHAALEWLGDLRERAPEAIRALKRQVRAAVRGGPGSGEEDADAFAGVWGGPAHREALAAMERRPTTKIPPDPAR
jgi:enoyl-CoA hydratase/carnithine racemase